MKKGPNIRIFWALTVVYSTAAILGAWHLKYFPMRLNPQEWGEVLSGVFSPLAFLWLIYAALSQKEELELQRLELQRNTETQKDQQAQLARQADVMESQMAHQRAQADALYEPILTLSTSSGGRKFSGDPNSSFAHLHVRNEGAAVIDVTIEGENKFRSISIREGFTGRSIKGNVLGHWPKDAIAQIDIASLDSDALYVDFEIIFTRLDLSVFSHTYRWTLNEERIGLLRRARLGRGGDV